MKIAIIGAGWNGIHTAIKLANAGHQVTLYESNNEILSGISGTFGVRVHIGPHYPQSKATRKACQADFSRFVKEYKDIIVEHDKSYYALGEKDVQENPPRVDDTTFSKVCREFRFEKTIPLSSQSEFSRSNLTSLHSVYEPSALVGQPLREKLLKRLLDANIDIRCSSKVTKVLRKEQKFMLGINELDDKEEAFDHVINTTAFQSLVPKEPLPFNMNVVSQICAVTVVEDLQPKSDKPFSFTVMDGRYPCIMPYLDGSSNHYIIYHSLYTILATFSTYQESWDYVKEKVDGQYLYEKVVSPSLEDMSRFMPGIKERFRVIDTKMGILQKVDTNREYRGPIVFQSPEGMIYSIPSKITNVCSAADDVLFLINPDKQKNILCSDSGYRYVPGGTLDTAKSEVSEERTDPNRVCAINILDEYTLKRRKKQDNKHRFFQSSCNDSSDSHLSVDFSIQSTPPQTPRSLSCPENDDDNDSTPPEYDHDFNDKRLLELPDLNTTPQKKWAGI